MHIPETIQEKNPDKLKTQTSAKARQESRSACLTLKSTHISQGPPGILAAHAPWLPLRRPPRVLRALQRPAVLQPRAEPRLRYPSCPAPAQTNTSISSHFMGHKYWCKTLM